MMLTVNLLATELLLAQTPTPTPPPGPNSTGAEFGKSGPFGLVIVLLLLIGVVFLIRSMNRHLRKLPANFDEESTAGAEASSSSTTTTKTARPAAQ
ncbi:MAG: hypothetical protein ACXVGB_07965 [Mycobacteriaceae bacterium]